MFAGIFRLIFLSAIFTSPIYIFESGNPQPTDFVMLAAVFAAFLVVLAENKWLGG